MSRSAHRQEVEALRAEVARLDEESRANARSVDALERERDGLLEEIEGLRDARESLGAELEARSAKLRDMRVGYDALVKDLEEDVAAGQLRIEQLTEGLSFRLPQDVLFPPGSAVLEPKGRRAVADIAARIKDREGRVEVQGHTDDRAIRGALAQRYPTNWELAGARAASVVRVLEESGVGAERLAAVSFGPTRPLASNDTPEGRAQNRRIEVRVLPTPASPLRGAEPEGEPASVEAGPPAQGAEGAAAAEAPIEPLAAEDGAGAADARKAAEAREAAEDRATDADGTPGDGPAAARVSPEPEAAAEPAPAQAPDARGADEPALERGDSPSAAEPYTPPSE
ncbi:MAG TPA: OmpA family protein [Myxococcota bacterium]|nr:OmpA family protein [Myxococcota bacterium]